MDIRRKAIKSVLSNMDKNKALSILGTFLPEREKIAIYYHDIEKEPIWYIGDVRFPDGFKCGENTVKKYRRNGYDRLISSQFFDP